MIEGVHVGRDWLGNLRRAPGRQFQQGLCRFARQTVGQFQDAVLIRPADIIQPLRRHAVAEQFIIRLARKHRRFWRCGLLDLDVLRDGDLLDRLPNLNELGRAGLGMRLELATLSPAVGIVVVVRVAQQQTAGRPVDDQADGTRPRR